jgi:hypothetical protein
VSAARVVCGDALDVLRTLPDASVDALVTDPPAGIAFMGKDWDGDKGGRDQWIAWLAAIMREARRVLKPGSHALVWALPRTSHWTATAIEDAGFEIRDVVHHLFGTGFPKSLDVSKAIDRAAGAEREVIGSKIGLPGYSLAASKGASVFGGGIGGTGDPAREAEITAPATPEAAQWEGWGTALKPAAEHWILARVPLIGTVAENVLAHGTGALNIDGCRIALPSGDPIEGGVSRQPHALDTRGVGWGFSAVPRAPGVGRWPAHVTLGPDAAAELDEQSEGVSRFFYVAKPSTAERDAGLGRRNPHATVKPIALMRWLVRMITPPGGTVLDCFAGSGTTGIAAQLEGADFIGIERDPEYAETARKRIDAWREHEDKPKRAPKAKRTKAPKPKPARAEPSAPQLTLFGEAA